MENAFSSPPPGYSADLADKLAAWSTAREALLRHYEEVEGPTLKAFDEAKSAVPHFVAVSEHLGRTCSTSDSHTVDYARRYADGRIKVDPIPCLEAHRDMMLDLARAADRRDAEIARLRTAHGINELERRTNELIEAYDTTFDAVRDHPSANGADVVAKLLAIAQEADGPCRADCWAALVNDCRRLAPVEGC